MLKFFLAKMLTQINVFRSQINWPHFEFFKNITVDFCRLEFAGKTKNCSGEWEFEITNGKLASLAGAERGGGEGRHYS